MKNALKEEWKDLENIGVGEDLSVPDRSDRNRQIIAAYYRPKKREFPAGKFACALCSVALVAVVAAAVLPQMLKEENDGIYMDQSCVRTDLSMPLLSEETGVFFPDAVEGYSVSSTALYYDRETDAMLSVAVEYQAEDGTKFLVSIAVDKRCAEYITDYSWFNEATEPTRLGDKTVMVSVFGTVVAMRYETDERYVGFRFDATEKEVALRIADEIING